LVDRLLLKTMRKESPKAQIIGGKAAYVSANALRSHRGEAGKRSRAKGDQIKRGR
jgi:hypothetical protein